MKAIVLGKVYSLDMGCSTSVDVRPIEFKEKTVLCQYLHSYQNRMEEIDYKTFEAHGLARPSEPISLDVSGVKSLTEEEKIKFRQIKLYGMPLPQEEITTKIDIDSLENADPKILERIKLWQECMKPQPLPKKPKKLTHNKKIRTIGLMDEYMRRIKEMCEKLIADEDSGFSSNANALQGVRQYISHAVGMRSLIKYEKPKEETKDIN